MKVNLFTTAMGGGGAERVLLDIFKYQPQEIQTSLSFISKGELLHEDIPAHIYNDDGEVQRSQIKRVLLKYGRKTIVPLYMHRHHIKRNKYNVSVSFLKYPNLINMLATFFIKTSIVVSVRTNLSADSSWSTYGKIINRLNCILLNIRKPYVIVNSEDNKLHLQNTCGLNHERIICIYNPKDIDKIAILSQSSLVESFFETEELILLTVGRLHPQKGHVHLLRIFSNLWKIVPCRLVVCGIGELEEPLKKLAEDLGVSNSVLFTGWCDNPYKYMKRADIFVFPSLYEGQPNAMIEALICGCPIVSTDCDYGPREILSDGKYGLLSKKLDGNIENPVTTPLTDAERDMYDKVLYLIHHPEERERLRQLSSEQIHLFDKERCIKKYYDVFRAAAEGRPLTDIE